MPRYAQFMPSEGRCLRTETRLHETLERSEVFGPVRSVVVQRGGGCFTDTSACAWFRHRLGTQMWDDPAAIESIDGNVHWQCERCASAGAGVASATRRDASLDR